MKRIRNLFLLVTILSILTIFNILTACNKTQPQSIKINTYDGCISLHKNSQAFTWLLRNMKNEKNMEFYNYNYTQLKIVLNIY